MVENRLVSNSRFWPLSDEGEIVALPLHDWQATAQEAGVDPVATGVKVTAPKSARWPGSSFSVRFMRRVS